MSRRRALAQRRRVRGYSQEMFADAVGVDRTTVARWEVGDTEPQPWHRPQLARALGVSLDELNALLVMPDVGTEQQREDDRVDHALRHPSTVDLTAVNELAERIRAVDAQYDRAPSTSLLGPAGQLHGQVTYLRANTSTTQVRRALLLAEADSATFTSQLMWDVSQRRDHREPLAYLEQAVEAARGAGDPAREAYAILRQSYVALYGAKDPIKGAELAGRAAETARGTSPSLTGLALLHVAEGRAMSGEVAACEKALAQAEGFLDQATADDAATAHYTVNEWTRLAGSCYLSLGMADRAEPILRATVHALAEKKKSQAIAMGNLTLALIRQRKLDEARAAMHRTIDAVELTMGGGALVLAFGAGRELKEWRHEPWVQEIQDRLLGLIATA